MVGLEDEESKITFTFPQKSMENIFKMAPQSGY